MLYEVLELAGEAACNAEVEGFYMDVYDLEKKNVIAPEMKKRAMLLIAKIDPGMRKRKIMKACSEIIELLPAIEYK